MRGRHDLERLLARLHSGEINLLVGTQMIAKGPRHSRHHAGGRGGLRSCAVDAGFSRGGARLSADDAGFGRAGRGELPGRVVVQTYYPDHYAIRGRKHPRLRKLCRARAEVPPLDALSALRRAGQRAGAIAKTGGSGRLVGGAGQVVPEGRAAKGCACWGPCTAPIARIKGVYRFHMILKAASRKALNAALRGMLAHADAAGVPRRNLIVDVDAQRLM